MKHLKNGRVNIEKFIDKCKILEGCTMDKIDTIKSEGEKEPVLKPAIFLLLDLLAELEATRKEIDGKVEL